MSRRSRFIPNRSKTGRTSGVEAQALNPDYSLALWSFRRKIGKKLAKVRRKNGLTLRALGEKIGLTSGYISEVEGGYRGGSELFCERVAEVLGDPELGKLLGEAATPINGDLMCYLLRNSALLLRLRQKARLAAARRRAKAASEDSVT